MQKFAGKKVIVTGAAQGIGHATAIAFAREGALVWAADLSQSRFEFAQNPAITPVILDVTDPKAGAEFASNFTNIDILVNCAGIVAQGTILDTSQDEWRRSFDVNVGGIFNMIQNFLPALIANKTSAIINISSVVSDIKAVKNRCAYGASKAAVNGLTKSVAVDFLEKGVRCVAIAPGTVRTPSWQNRVNAAPDPKAAEADFIARQPMRRLGTPEEIAQMCLYLASDDAAFVTGQVFAIDGGMSL